MSAITQADVGKMYRVPWSPNPHKLEFVRTRHCQMHGEFIGMEIGLRKRRNSETRPWGSVAVVAIDTLGIEEIGSHDKS